MLTEDQKNFEAMMRLKSMKEGDKITWQHMAAIRHFFGDILEKIPEPNLIGAAYFKNGTILKTGALSESEIKEIEGLKRKLVSAHGLISIMVDGLRSLRESSLSLYQKTWLEKARKFLEEIGEGK